MKSPEEIVEEFARKLDELTPHWWKKINMNRLDMLDCYNCILGQIYVIYHEGYERLRREISLDNNPFDPLDFTNFIDTGNQKKDSLRLKKLWIQEILKRIN